MAKSRIPQPMSDAVLKKYRWVTKLTIPNVIPVSLPAGAPIPTTVKAGQTTQIHKFTDRIPAVPGKPDIATKVWGYGTSAGPITYPGPTLEAIAGQSASIEWVNNLPTEHPFTHPPRELMNGMPMGRYSVGHTVAHLHGAHVPWENDGYSMRVSTGMGNPTSANPVMPKTVLRPGEPAPPAHHYPNVQAGGAMLWYHDHTMDMTAKNVYSGLAGVYLLRHPQEKTEMDALFRPGVANPPANSYEIPLVLQDRSFTDDGELLYGDAKFLTKYLKKTGGVRVGRDAFHVDPVANAPMGEFKGQTLCVNGKVWPYLELERRPYRFRILNGSNSRMYVLRVDKEQLGTPSTPNRPDINQVLAAVPMHQIGGDGGFYSAAVALTGGKKNMPANAAIPEDILVLAPGERADIVIDFSSLPAGNYYLSNHATNGANNYGTNGDKARAGLTDALLQIRLLPAVSAAPAFNTNLNAVLTRLTAAVPGSGPQPTPATGANPLTSPAAFATAVSRSYRLEEGIVVNGTPGSPVAFIQPREINTLVDWNPITFEQLTAPASPRYSWAGQPPAVGAAPAGRPISDQIDTALATRHTLNGGFEKWEFINLTVDVHPIHLHHSMFYVLSRVPTDINGNVIGPVRAADPNESSGWKDTVRCNPGEITTLLVRFDDQGDPDPNNKYYGHYVFHCHLLEHEDMGMMRPLEIY